MKQKVHIGKQTNSVAMVVEAGLVSRFVDALEIEDPLSKDPSAAKSAGLPGLLLPHVAAGTLGDYQSVIELLELKPKQVLHSKDTVTVYEPICVGNEMTVTTRVKDLYEQQVGGNPMGFAIIEVIGTGKRSARVFEAERVLAVRGGFPRR
jgi:hypothetical protein